MKLGTVILSLSIAMVAWPSTASAQLKKPETIMFFSDAEVQLVPAGGMFSKRVDLVVKYRDGKPDKVFSQVGMVAAHEDWVSRLQRKLPFKLIVSTDGTL